MRLASSIRLDRAGVTIASVIASFCATYALCRRFDAHAGPAILSAILALSLSRRGAVTHGIRAVLLPAIIAGTALAAAGVGWLLFVRPVVGALVFTGGMFLSVWLRNFGERGRAAGALIGLPLVAMLVAPARADAPGGLGVDLGLLIAAAFTAYAAAAACRWLGARVGVTAAGPERAMAPHPPRRPGQPLSPSTRLAFQMAVGVGAAFAVGLLVFPAHWGWCVFSAFIVASGARSRGDAAYKGVLRLGGAFGGTLAAAALFHIVTPTGTPAAILIFVILFVGLALREANYAYWASCMTLVLALIAQPAMADGPFLFVRLEAIFCGAACAALAAWYVLPIRVEAVIRRRLADALAALDELATGSDLSAQARRGKLEAIDHRMYELEQVAPPARWHRRLFVRGDRTAHPASWIDLAHGVHATAQALAAESAYDERRRSSIHRAIGISRRAIAAHGKRDTSPESLTVSAALQKLHDTLQSA